MTYETVKGMKHYIADEGMRFIVAGNDDDNSIVTEIWLSESDSIDHYVEIPLPDQDEMETDYDNALNINFIE